MGMVVRRKIKYNARRAVTQNYIRALAVTLIFFCVSLLFAVFVAVTNTVVEMFASQMTPPISIFEGWSYLYSPIVVGISLLFEWFLFSPLILGTAKWFYRLSSGEPGDAIDLFDYFSGRKSYFSSLWMELNLFLRRLFYSFLFLLVPFVVFFAGLTLLDGRWTVSGPVASLVGMVLMIAGMVLLATSGLFAWVFSKRYFLARYLFLEGDRTVRQSIRQSLYFMKGRKGELFLFDLSFTAWAISCLLVIPAFFVAPYYMCSSALYAKIIIEQQQRATQTEQQQDPTREFDTDDLDALPEEPADEDAGM